MLLNHLEVSFFSGPELPLAAAPSVQEMLVVASTSSTVASSALGMGIAGYLAYNAITNMSEEHAGISRFGSINANGDIESDEVYPSYHPITPDGRDAGVSDAPCAGVETEPFTLVDQKTGESISHAQKLAEFDRAAWVAGNLSNVDEGPVASKDGGDQKTNRHGSKKNSRPSKKLDDPEAALAKLMRDTTPAPSPAYARVVAEANDTGDGARLENVIPIRPEVGRQRLGQVTATAENQTHSAKPTASLSQTDGQARFEMEVARLRRKPRTDLLEIFAALEADYVDLEKTIPKAAEVLPTLVLVRLGDRALFTVLLEVFLNHEALKRRIAELQVQIGHIEQRQAIYELKKVLQRRPDLEPDFRVKLENVLLSLRMLGHQQQTWQEAMANDELDEEAFADAAEAVPMAQEIALETVEEAVQDPDFSELPSVVRDYLEGVNEYLRFVVHKQILF